MSPVKSHTDIRKNTLLTRFLPEKARPYAGLMRLDRPIGWWLLLLPGWWSIGLAAQYADGGVTGRHAALLALFWIGAVLMRGAGCVINDLWDRDLDGKVERTAARPLPAGEVTPRGAMIFLAGLLGVSFLILCQMNMATILLGLCSLPLIVAYPYMKRITWWPQAFLGITFNFGALMGWAAVTGSVGWPAIMLYGAGIAWTLGYDTIYAHQDIEDDAQVGIKSSARALGARSPVFIGIIYAVCFALLVAGFAVAGAGVFAFVILGCAGAQLVWQLRAWNMHDPASCLLVFKSNRDFGLLVFLASLL